MGNVAAAENNNNKTTVTFQQVHDRLGHIVMLQHGKQQNNSAYASRKDSNIHALHALQARPNKRTSNKWKQQNKSLDNDTLTLTSQRFTKDRGCPSPQNPTGESSLSTNESKSSSPSFSRQKMQWLSQHVNSFTNDNNQTLASLT